MKKLIVNADDFGITEGVNLGIIYSFKKGIVSSASLMVNRSGAENAAKLSKKNLRLGVGLHFEIMADDSNFIRGIKKVLAVFNVEKAKKQFYEQIEIFQRLMDKMPDHIDGHYHVHKLPGILSFVKEFSRKYKIPVRAIGDTNFIDSFSTLNPKDATREKLIKILRNLPDGVSELMTHAGYSTYELKAISSLSDQRGTELEVLTSPEIKKTIKEEKIQLISWKDYLLT